MGLRDDIQLAVLEAFDGDLSDVVTEFDLVKIVLGDYNVATGSRTETATNYFTKGVFAAYGTDEVDGQNVKSTDEKVIVNAINLLFDGVQVEPSVDDVLQIASGDDYNVLAVKKVMGGGVEPILFVLQVRANG